MKKKLFTMEDVERNMGISVKDFVSKSAAKMGDPSWHGIDVLAEVCSAALAHDYPNEEEEEEEEEEEKKDRSNASTSRVKRPFDEDEEVDYEEEAGNTRGKKKSKIMKKKKLEKKKIIGSKLKQWQVLLPMPPPPLPQVVREAIRENGANEEEEPLLVIQKELRLSDTRTDQNRLSIPVSQADMGFLNEDEVTFLRKRKADKGVESMEVGFIQPNLKKREGIRLRRWEIGKGSQSYMLTGKWSAVVKDECYRNDPNPKGIQLWAYRANGKLCFALVNVPVCNPGC